LSKALRISPELSLPLDFATEGVIVLGMRGSGKSNTEARFAEVEYAAGIPFVVVDPKGDWHGIRTSADGTKAGLAVPVFGGLHGDFPLDASLGKRIADLLVDENLSAMLDVSRMSKTVELPRFLADFFDQLMLRHQEEPHVRTVILEEAHRYIPQQVPGSMARVKEAAGAVLLEGRAWGLGCWACSQRPARINKDILEEVSTAILHRIGPMATNDKRTIAGWVKHYDLSDEIIASITKLRDGEGWVLAPVSLGILQRVQMDRRQTFDSAATPKVGAKVRRPSTMADIDAGAIKEALATSIEKAKADDPKELRRRIAQLEKELRKRSTEKEAERIEVRVEVPVITKEQEDRFVAAMDAYVDGGHAAKEAADVIAAAVMEAKGGRQDISRAGRAGRGARPMGDESSDIAGKGFSDRVTARERHGASQRPDPPARREPRRPPVPGAEAAEGLGGGAPAKILAALAQHHPEALSQRRLAALVGVKQKTSTMRNALSRLRGLAYVTGSAYISITDEGLAAAPAGDTLPTGPELLDHWRQKLGDGAPRRILDALLSVFPETLEADELAERADVEPGTSTLRNAMSKLRSLGLVDGWDLADDFVEAAGL
jgi:hypothetical protein